MNCKPGDLAVIVAPYLDTRMLGLVVTIEKQTFSREDIRAKNGELSHGDGGGNCWIVDAHSSHCPCVVGGQCLRPIRDHGDDAVDESKAWLPPVPLPIIDPQLLEVGK